MPRRKKLTTIKCSHHIHPVFLRIISLLPCKTQADVQRRAQLAVTLQRLCKNAPLDDIKFWNQCYWTNAKLSEAIVWPPEHFHLFSECSRLTARPEETTHA